MVTPSPAQFLALILAASSFALPGWLLTRLLPSASGALGTFLGSAAILFNLILLLDALHLPLHVGTVGAGLLLISAGLAWRARRLPPGPARPAIWPALPRGTDWLWVVPAALALLTVCSQAFLSPLSGYDNAFRWDYLGRLLLARESLSYYPPMTTADFDLYGWCDGIPPLVPMLNFWTYAVTGSVAPALTAARVIAESVLLAVAIHHLARSLWGERAGGPAVAVAATSSLLIWGIAIGQETGLTALALAAMLVFLEEHRRTLAKSDLFWAGLAAGVGALSREYGLAYLLFGGGILLARRQGRAGLPVFAAVAGLTALPWYLRNWIMTGNPVYPQSLGGLFPTNPIHTEIMASIADSSALLRGLRLLPAILAAVAGTVALLGAVGAWRAGRRGAVYLAGIVLMLGLWIWSIPQTAGGYTYGTRLLTPALALAAALAGWVGTVRPAGRILLASLLIPLAIDAARRSWMLPPHALVAPWPYNLAVWQDPKVEIEAIRVGKIWPILVAGAAGEGIVVDHPTNQTEINGLGGLAVPLFSPRLAPAFDPNLPFAEVVRRLRANHVRLITLSLTSPTTLALVSRHPFLHELCQNRVPVARLALVTIYDLATLAEPPPAAP